MTALSKEEKLAILLNSLPAEVRTQLLRQIAPDPASPLHQLIQRTPPRLQSAELIEQVMREFSELLAQISIPKPLPPKVETKPVPLTSSEGDLPAQQGTSHPQRTLATNPLGALRSLQVDDLCFALEGEQPHTIGLILNVISEDKAADLLRRLPEEQRRKVTVQLAVGGRPDPILIRRVAEVLLKKCDGGHFAANEETRLKRTAEILKRFDSAEQTQILATLERQDSSAAAQIRQHLSYAGAEDLSEENHQQRKAA